MASRFVDFEATGFGWVRAAIASQSAWICFLPLLFVPSDPVCPTATATVFPIESGASIAAFSDVARWRPIALQRPLYTCNPRHMTSFGATILICGKRYFRHAYPISPDAIPLLMEPR